MSMNHCEKCGAKLTDTEAPCRICGAQPAQSAPATPVVTSEEIDRRYRKIAATPLESRATLVLKRMAEHSLVVGDGRTLPLQELYAQIYAVVDKAYADSELADAVAIVCCFNVCRQDLCFG
jgi:hypothetical protein